MHGMMNAWLLCMSPHMAGWDRCRKPLRLSLRSGVEAVVTREMSGMPDGVHLGWQLRHQNLAMMSIMTTWFFSTGPEAHGQVPNACLGWVDKLACMVCQCSWEKENVSSEALEAARVAANKYMVKVSARSVMLLTKHMFEHSFKVSVSLPMVIKFICQTPNCAIIHVAAAERRQGCLPPARACAPLPRAAYQQDAFVRRR